MTKPLLLVIGATGTIGREVTAQLVAAGQRVRALVRDPAPSLPFTKDVEIFTGDLDRPRTLDAAFAGVDKVFVLTRGPNLRQEINAFEAAHSAGAYHIVKLSRRGADTYNKGTYVGQTHLESEARLRAVGIPWTIVRPGFFTSNIISSYRVLERGGLHLPAGEGKDSPIDPRDVAAVVVRVMTSSGHEGKIYEITGPELLSYGEMVRTMEALAGRALRYVDITGAAFRETLSAAGVPEPIISSNIHYFASVREGRLSTTGTFADLMGRKPSSFSEWFQSWLTKRGGRI